MHRAFFDPDHRLRSGWAIALWIAVMVALGAPTFWALDRAGAMDVLRSGVLQAAVLFPSSAAEEVIVYGFLLQQLVRAKPGARRNAE